MSLLQVPIVRNPFAQEASCTPEGMADYLDFLHHVDEASSQSHSLLRPENTSSELQAAVSTFLADMSRHVLCFLDKYEYRDLYTATTSKCRAFVNQLSEQNNTKEGVMELTRKFLSLASVLDDLILNVSIDFSAETLETPDPHNTTVNGAVESIIKAADENICDAAYPIAAVPTNGTLEGKGHFQEEVVESVANLKISCSGGEGKI